MTNSSTSSENAVYCQRFAFAPQLLAWIRPRRCRRLRTCCDEVGGTLRAVELLRPVASTVSRAAGAHATDRAVGVATFAEDAGRQMGIAVGRCQTAVGDADDLAGAVEALERRHSVAHSRSESRLVPLPNAGCTTRRTVDRPQLARGTRLLDRQRVAHTLELFPDACRVRG
jgi:hypothetical protein